MIAVDVAGNADIGDLAEAQHAAIAPEQAEPKRERDVEKIEGEVVAGEFADRSIG